MARNWIGNGGTKMKSFHSVSTPYILQNDTKQKALKLCGKRTWCESLAIPPLHTWSKANEWTLQSTSVLEPAVDRNRQIKWDRSNRGSGSYLRVMPWCSMGKILPKSSVQKQCKTKINGNKAREAIQDTSTNKRHTLKSITEKTGRTWVRHQGWHDLLDDWSHENIVDLHGSRLRNNLNFRNLALFKDFNWLEIFRNKLPTNVMNK